MNILEKLNSYDVVFFDFDGVLVDSNEFKKKYIFIATNSVVNKTEAYNFTEYFVSNNGIPREIKLNNYFDKKTAKIILKEYNFLLKQNENKIKINKDLVDILNLIKSKKIVLSGGDFNEIKRILITHKLLDKFDKILASPKTKDENLSAIKISGEKIFIGDSKVDYEVSLKHNLDFIFYAKYTQEKKPYSFLSDRVIIINN